MPEPDRVVQALKQLFQVISWRAQPYSVLPYRYLKMIFDKSNLAAAVSATFLDLPAA
jgi:hypothetical protein